eukprot:Gb_25835 [translate_table: standard]
MDSKKLHVVVFPWFAHGHISPFLELSHRLATDDGLRVSFVSTPRNIARIKRLVEPERGHIDLVELPLPSVEGLPNGAESTADVPNEMIPLLLKAVDMWENPFETLLRQLRPHCIIHDFAQCWTPRLAAKLGIPSIFFIILGGDSSSFFRAISRVLEGKYLECLQRSTGKPVFPVGPMLIQPPKQTTTAVLDTETPYCLRWLDDRAPSSVVYVSLGSECFPSQEQIHALALGLEASHVPFLWALLFPNNDVEKCVSAVMRMFEQMLPSLARFWAAMSFRKKTLQISSTISNERHPATHNFFMVCSA